MSGARLCSVPQCTNVKTINNSFHSFPKEDVLKKKWLKVLRMRCATTSMKVCSDHFTPENFFFPEYNTVRRALKKGSIPSRNIPTTSPTKQIASSVVAKARTARSRKRIQWKEKINFLANNSQSVDEEEEEEEEEEDEEDEEDEDKVSMLDIDKKSHLITSFTHEDVKSQILSKNEQSELLENNVQPMWPYVMQNDNVKKPLWLNRKIQCLQTTININNINVMNFLRSNNELNVLTGVTSFVILEKLENSMKSIELIAKPKHRFVLTIRERIILTLMKLKTNMTFICLAALFGISAAESYEYFCLTLVLLREVVSSLIKLPDKHEIVQNMPRCFKNFANTRVILDCLVITIKKSKFTRLDVNGRYHDEKGDIVKYLIGTIPSGSVCFLSSSYNDRVSDDELFIDSGIMERLSNNDTIITNKRFHVQEELQALGLQLINPNLLLDDNLSSPAKISEILALKIHAKQVFQRIQIFKILKYSLPRSLLVHLDSIMIVICGLVNLIPCLTNDEYS